VELDDVDTRILEELQYNFPLTKTPYKDSARNIGISTGMLLDKLRKLASTGLIKRIGFYLNYKARRLQAALIAVRVEGGMDSIIDTVSMDEYTTHAYLRDHPVYNVWIVSKRGTREELVDFARRLAERAGTTEWTVLFGVRTWKLSVKYDLARGVSRSASSHVVPPVNPPILTSEELAIATRLRKLPIEERPYNIIGSELSLGEDHVYNTMINLLRKGALGDPGAALDGGKIGFKENVMLMTRPGNSDYTDLCRCLANVSYTTHVVQREEYPRGSCRYKCYAMVHAVDKARLSRVIDEIVMKCNPSGWLQVKSLRDLKPGVVR
jgi:DNA-binding Lrp family transcriptional regulator